MDGLIAASEGKSFSGEDILDLTDKKCRIVEYRELSQYPTLKAAMGKHKAMAVLYETRENYGHWVAVIQTNESLLEVFDSYGLGLDEQLKFINPYFRKVSGQSVPHLSHLIATSGIKLVVTNDSRLQAVAADTNTCGRWVGLRIAMRDYPLENFIALFKKQKQKPDWYVTALTMFI